MKAPGADTRSANLVFLLGRNATPVLVAAAIGIFLLTSITVAHMIHIEQDNTRITHDRMRFLAQYGKGMRMMINDIIEERSEERLPIMLKNLTPTGSSISSALLDDNYRVVSSSRPDWPADSLPSDQPAILAGMLADAIEDGGQVLADDQLHLLLPLRPTSLLTADRLNQARWIYLHADLRPVLVRHFSGLVPSLLVTLLLACVATLWAVWLLRKRISLPLDELVKSTARAAGDPSVGLTDDWAARMRRVAAHVGAVESELERIGKRADTHGRALRLLKKPLSSDLSDTSEQLLVQQACEALVNEGFVSAWVSVMQEQRPMLRFIAGAGEALSPEAISDMCLDESHLAALQSGGVVSCPFDTFAGPLTEWMRNSRSRGCTGFALVPLHDGIALDGMLVLLARETDLFEEELLDAVRTFANTLAWTRRQVVELKQQRAASDEIARSRAMLRAVIDSIPDLIFFKNKASVYLGCNRAFEALIAKPEAVLIGGTDFDCFPAEVARKFRDNDSSLFAKGESIRFLEWVDYPDGRHCLLESLKTPYRDAKGHVLGLVGISRDVTMQYLTEKELAAERGLFVAGPTVVFRWRNEEGWPIEYVSENVLEQFGYEANALVQGRQRFAELVHPEDLARLMAEVTGYLENPACTTFTQRYRLRLADQSYRSVSDYTVILRDGETGEIDIRGYLIDVSDVANVESSLRERIKELKGLYAVLHELSSTERDIDKVLQAVVDVLPASFQFPDLASARLRFRDRTYIAGNFVATRWLLHEERQLEDGLSLEIDVAYSTCPKEAEDAVFLNEEKELLQAIALELDRFNARREAERQRTEAHVALREAAQRLKLVAQNSSDLLYQSNVDTGEREWLTDIGAALGYAPSAVQGAATQDWRSLIHPEDVVEFDQALAAVTSGNAYTARYRVRVGDASWRLMHDRGSWIESNGERMAVGACSDITDITLVEEQRERMAAHLHQTERMETLGMLTRGLTVELNNKLQGISGFAHLALRRIENLDQDKLTSYFERIETAAQQAAMALSGITEFSDMAGKATSRLNMTPIVKKAMDLVRPSLAANVIMRLHVHPNLPLVAGVPGDILQVVINLCLNAKQSLVDGGEINLDLANAEDVDQQCSACGQSISGDWVELAVSDNGAPIPAELIAGMFDPTQKQVTYERFGSFGMAAVHRIVSSGGGHLVVEPHNDRGNQVRVFLPCLQQKTTSSIRQAGPETFSAMGEGLNAIVVDDDTQSGELLSEQLSVFGFRCERFEGGEAALARLRNDDPPVDLVMTDQNMPGMRGTVLSQALRSEGKTFPILVYSGFCPDLSKESIGEYGADGFLASPFGLQELDICLRALFPRDADAG